MKPRKLIHPSHAREGLSEQDAANLRRSGWLELSDAHPVSESAAWQRQYRKHCRELGLKRITAYIPLQIFNELMALKQDGETTADLLIRIIELLRSCDENPR